MAAVDQRAHHRGGIERIAGNEGRRVFAQRLQERLLNARFDQQASAGDAHLPLIIEDAGGGAAGGLIQIRAIGEDDIGALAAGLQPDARFMFDSPA